MKLPRWMQWRTDRELDEEIQAHLDLTTQANVESGMAPEEARSAALRALGNITRVRELARQTDPLFWLESFSQDIRYALRNLAHHPSFTAAAVLSLALGIGANSAIFSYVDGLLLRPLDVPNASELVRVHAHTPNDRFARFAYREYAALRDRNRTLDGLAAELDGFFAMQSQQQEQARVAYGDFVSANYFEVLGVQPMLGRIFRPEEDSAAVQDTPAILSYGAWTSKFHSDPRIAGTRIKVNAQDAVVIGVLPETFSGTQGAVPEIYFPLAAQPTLTRSGVALEGSKYGPFLGLLGHLKPGTSEKVAQADFSVLASALEVEYPDTNHRRTFAVLTDRETKLQEESDLVFVVSRRTKELGIRMALGATRGAILVDVLASSLKTVALGTGIGVVAALATTRYFSAFMGRVSPTDPAVFVGVPMLLLGVAFLAAWVPARRASLVDPAITLRHE